MQSLNLVPHARVKAGHLYNRMYDLPCLAVPTKTYTARFLPRVLGHREQHVMTAAVKARSSEKRTGKPFPYHTSDETD